MTLFPDFLLVLKGFFFQLPEREKEMIFEFSPIITEDPRDESLIKIVDKPVVTESFKDGYYCDL